MTISESAKRQIEEIEAKAEKKEQAMYGEIGRFVCAFAKAESVSNLLFQYVSKLNETTARAIIGGSRLTDLLAIIQRLAPGADLDVAKKKEIQSIVDQFREISRLRNFICHSGADAGDEDNFSSWNIHSAKTLESVKILESDLKALRSATNDAHCISFRILYLVSPDYRKTVDQIPHGRRNAILGPWRYKFVEPKIWNPKVPVAATQKQAAKT